MNQEFDRTQAQTTSFANANHTQTSQHSEQVETFAPITGSQDTYQGVSMPLPTLTKQEQDPAIKPLILDKNMAETALSEDSYGSPISPNHDIFTLPPSLWEREYEEAAPNGRKKYLVKGVWVMELPNKLPNKPPTYMYFDVGLKTEQDSNKWTSFVPKAEGANLPTAEVTTDKLSEEETKKNRIRHLNRVIDIALVDDNLYTSLYKRYEGTKFAEQLSNSRASRQRKRVANGFMVGAGMALAPILAVEMGVWIGGTRIGAILANPKTLKDAFVEIVRGEFWDKMLSIVENCTGIPISTILSIKDAVDVAKGLCSYVVRQFDDLIIKRWGDLESIPNLSPQGIGGFVDDAPVLRSQNNTPTGAGGNMNPPNPPNKAPRLVDGVTLEKHESNAVNSFIKRKYPAPPPEDFVRIYRNMVAEFGEQKVSTWLGATLIDRDIDRLQQLVKVAGNDASKVENFLKQVTHRAVFEKIVDDYLPHFKKMAVTSTKPKYFNNPNAHFKDINMQHIMDKHTMEHFDWSNAKNQPIDFFPAGTTQQDVADLIDEALEKLAQTYGKDHPLPGNPLKVTLSDGRTYKIGSELGEDIKITKTPFAPKDNIIGQFYPIGGVSIKPNILFAIKSLIH